MVISHRYKFIFIKTVKTAGTSIEVFLSDLCGPSDVLTPINPPVPPHRPRNCEGYRNHLTAQEVRSRIGEVVWNDYFTFCVERNPWDKVLSYWHMINARKGLDLTLDACLAEHKLPINLPRYTESGEPSRVLVDRVLRYERLDEELTQVFGSLGVPFPGQLGVHAKANYRTDRRHHREVFSAAQANRVEQIFGDEIALHGYEF
jgi:hypothetical protein